MCVSARGKMLALIATSFHGRAMPLGRVTARMDSLLVRTRCPSRSLILGSEPASLAQLYKTHPPLDARLDRIDQRGYGALETFTTRE